MQFRLSQKYYRGRHHEGAIAPDVIQNVDDDSGEPLAVISQTEAADTQCALLEAASDMWLKRSVLFEISHEALRR